MEQALHGDSCFATLTYKDAPAELIPDDMQGFLKRARYHFKLPIRYYGVGEYGDKGGRPHFHLALFGVPVIAHEIVEKAWGLGFVHLGDLTKDSASYIAGYVTKKMTKADDPRLEGRHPEFARMSLRPGIGAGFVKHIAAAIAPSGDLTTIYNQGDVPAEVRIGRKYPIGRYLRGKLRESLGWAATQPPEIKRLWREQYLSLTPLDHEMRRQRRYHDGQQAEGKQRFARSKKKL